MTTDPLTEAVRRVRGRGWDYRAKPYLRWVASEEKLVPMVRAQIFFYPHCVICSEPIKDGEVYQLDTEQKEFQITRTYRHLACCPLTDWAKKWRGK